MTVKEVAERLNLTVHVEAGGDEEVTGGYACDLLSWVIGKAGSGSAWITIMSNANVAAVALLADTSMIILTEGVQPDPALLDKATQQGIGLFTARESSYEVAWRLHALIG